jgi:hypothetical protein
VLQVALVKILVITAGPDFVGMAFRHRTRELQTQKHNDYENKNSSHNIHIFTMYLFDKYIWFIQAIGLLVFVHTQLNTEAYYEVNRHIHMEL